VEERAVVYCYGDESIKPDVTVFAVAVFPDNRVAEAEVVLATEKQSIGVPPEAILHCSELFHQSKREKTAWKNVTIDTIWSMLFTLCAKLNAISHPPIVSVIPSEEVPAGAVAPESPLGALDRKGLATLGYTTVQIGLIQRYGIKEVRLWLDPDKAKIQWGQKRRKADSTRSVFYDEGHGQEPPLIKPEFTSNPKPRLLEVADLYAYVSANAASKGKMTDKFILLRDLIAPNSADLILNAKPKLRNSSSIIGNSLLDDAIVLWELKKGDQIAVCRFSPVPGYWVSVYVGEQGLFSEMHETKQKAFSRSQEMREELLREGWQDY
jgi:hypothetical protein